MAQRSSVALASRNGPVTASQHLPEARNTMDETAASGPFLRDALIHAFKQFTHGDSKTAGDF